MVNEREHVSMSTQEEGLQSHLVAGLKRDGRRKYDKIATREQMQTYLNSRVSIGRVAMDMVCGYCHRHHSRTCGWSCRPMSRRFRRAPAASD